MSLSNPRSVLGALLAFAFTIFALSAFAFGQTESILYTFTGGSDGSGPTGSLIFDAAGNLYGTTDAGGVNDGNGGKGVVFELSPASGGGWTETALYAFQGGSDGEVPFGGVIFDAAGNLYGTTNFGGAHNKGTVYELSPVAGGGWTEQVLYSFGKGNDAALPNGGLVFDSAGNLYGTTSSGGSQNLGTVFQLSPVAGGGWTETVILNGTALYGGSFNGSVTLDNSGNFYVPAPTGSSSNAGSVYRVTHTLSGWHHGVIYSFLGGADGSEPVAGLTFRAPNILFGTTEGGGTFSSGTAFELTRTGSTWNKTILHDFGVTSKDGLFPTIPFTIGATGQLYGTNGSGGTAGGGTAFELAKDAAGWKEKILHNFTTGADAGGPEGGVVLDGAGNLFGMGHNGGSFGAGAVYEITP
jgi:uncharacterized repeat protein (TIGR03803 family)